MKEQAKKEEHERELREKEQDRIAQQEKNGEKKKCV